KLLITLPTTAHNLDRRRKGESCCALLEVVGVLLWHRLTKRNEISTTKPAFARGSQFLHRRSSELRRKVALENSANAGLQKVCRSYARVRAGHSAMARVS